MRDGAERAGTILSFERGVLSLRLAGGAVVSGFADDSTKVRCGSERGLEKSHKSRRRGHSKASTARSTEAEEDPGAPEEEPLEEEASEDEEGDSEDFQDAFENQLEDEKSGADGKGDGMKPCGVSYLDPGSRVHQATLELTPTACSSPRSSRALGASGVRA